MIRPNMATMLGYLATDAAIDPALLPELARELADDPRVVEAYLGLGSKHQAMLSS